MYRYSSLLRSGWNAGTTPKGRCTCLSAHCVSTPAGGRIPCTAALLLRRHYWSLPSSTTERSIMSFFCAKHPMSSLSRCALASCMHAATAGMSTS